MAFIINDIGEVVKQIDFKAVIEYTPDNKYIWFYCKTEHTYEDKIINMETTEIYTEEEYYKAIDHVNKVLFRKPARKFAENSN